MKTTALAFFVLLAAIATVPAGDSIKVFILAGQSNMEGKVQKKLIDHQAVDAKTSAIFKHLRMGHAFAETMLELMKE